MSLHFLDIPTEVANDPSAPYAVLPLPYERTVSYGIGTAEGPAAILRASQETEDFDEEFRQRVDCRVQTLAPPAFEHLDDEAALVVIRRAATDPLSQGRFLLSLGGEHTVTAPLVQAAMTVAPDLSVLQLDAHLDLRETYTRTPHPSPLLDEDDGMTRWSHACVMRRIRELGVPTVHVGSRATSSDEYAWAKDHDVSITWAGDMVNDRDSSWIQRVLDQLSDNVYVTADMDVFDPSLVPGTGTPEPGGLSWQQVTGLLRAVFEKKAVIAADIVELAPIPHTQVSEFVAARLGLKMLVYKQIL